MKKTKSFYVLLYPLFLSLLLCGCTTTNGQKASKVSQDTISYKTETLSFPDYGFFDDAYSNGVDIYYFASDLDEASQKYQSSFYILKQGSTTPEKSFSLQPGQRVQNMTMDSSGNIYYLGYEEILSEDGEPQTSPALTLCKTDEKGAQLFAVDLSGNTLNQNQPVIQDLAVDGESRIVLFSSNQEIYVLTPNGEPLFKDKTMGKIHGICGTQEKVYIGYQDGNGLSIKEVDIPTRKL